MRKIFLMVVPVLFAVADGSAQTWTWMKGDSTLITNGQYGTKGVAAPSNKPPGLYEPCEWRDLNGNFWMFSGAGYAAWFNALWRYDAVTNEWTWVNGSYGNGRLLSRIDSQARGSPDSDNLTEAKSCCAAAT